MQTLFKPRDKKLPPPQQAPEPGTGEAVHWAGPGTESQRINLLIARDGEETARAWVEQTLAIYRDAVSSPHSHASKREYRALFLQSIKEFEEWLGQVNSLPH